MNKEPLDEYSQNHLRMRPYDDAFDQKLARIRARKGRGIQLNQIERQWEAIRYYYEASIVNSGDMFSYLHYIYGNRAAFEALGATGTLAAADKMRPLYDEQQSLPTDEEKTKFWLECRDECDKIVEVAEGMDEFARLIIAFGEKNADKIGKD